ncbi:hypothetical protein PanWU01x14_365680 [Parasponia andersonii]|uniref:Uncharacterized protein n=1 Tax=Parasponia andersonii TaxID=3476 RepID=A0A2P5A5Z2_PARAD|nr:hypothetical protein PanWU01x14_365680 [Parasponia andersonii]
MYRIHAKVGSKHIDAVGLVNYCSIKLVSSLKLELDSSASSSGLATISGPKAMEHCLLEEAPAKVWEADSCFNSPTKVGRLRTH